MVKTNTLLVGAGSLLLCLVLARQLSVNFDPPPMDLDSLGLVYLSAAPYALVTPVESQVRAGVTPFSDRDHAAVRGLAPAQALGDLLAEYVRLHQTRMDRRP